MRNSPLTTLVLLTGAMSISGAITLSSSSTAAFSQKAEPLPAQPASSKSFVVAKELTRTGENDPGTITLSLLNSGRDAVSVRSIKMDGYDIECVPAMPQETPKEPSRSKDTDAILAALAAKRILYATMPSRPLQPGARGRIEIKLALPAIRPVRIDVDFASHTESHVVSHGKKALTLCSMGFNSPSEFTVFVEASTEISKSGLARILVDDQAATPLTPSLFVPGEKCAIRCRLASPRKPGAPPYTRVRIETESGLLCEADASVTDRFVLQADHLTDPGNVVEVAGLDRPSVLPPTHPTVPPDGAWQVVFECPMHVHGDHLQLSAKDILKGRSRVQNAAAIPCGVHICKSRIQEGLGLFGRCADFVVVNPNGRCPEKATLLESIRHNAELMSTAYRAARPSPVLAVLETIGNGGKGLCEKEMLRARAFAALGNGAKGLLVRHTLTNSPENSRTLRHVQELTEELREVRRMLNVSDPVGWLKPTNNSVVLYSLLLDENRLLVFALKSDSNDSTPIDCTWHGPANRKPAWSAEVQPKGEFAEKIALRDTIALPATRTSTIFIVDLAGVQSLK